MSLPLSIPLDIKIKGLKALIKTVQEQGILLQQLKDGMGFLMTNVERLGTTLDNIKGDIAGLKEAATTKADADAATIAQLTTDVTAATDRANLSDAQKAEVQAALDTATASLENAQAEFDSSLQPLVDKADAIDAETPGAVTPEEPAPPVEPEPEPTPDPEPVPPVEENPPAPEEENPV